MSARLVAHVTAARRPAFVVGAQLVRRHLGVGQDGVELPARPARPQRPYLVLQRVATGDLVLDLGVTPAPASRSLADETSAALATSTPRWLSEPAPWWRPR